ncbi:MAG: LysR family transcriptional regulator [Clostridium sp.]
MNTLHYDYFIAIAENKTLSQAARTLHVSQSVLSRYLKNLEEETGIRLFLTSSGCYTLTQAGQIYLKSARKIQLLQSQLHQKLTLLEQDSPNEVRFGIPPIRGGAALAYIYPYLLEQYPYIQVSVTNEGSASLHEKLLAHQLDFILLMIDDCELQRKYDYLFFSLEQKQILLGIPSFHPLYDKGGTATAPAALSVSELSAMEDAPFILPDIGTVIGERVSRFLEQNHLKFNIQLKTSNRLTNEHLLAEGSYAGFLDEASAFGLPQLHYFFTSRYAHSFEGFAFRKGHVLTPMEKFFYLSGIPTPAPGKFCIFVSGRKHQTNSERIWRRLLMNSRIYEYLLAIEEEQNISRAAARCLLSQPALSQQLKIFEEKLGFPVFARSKSAMLPTERGKSCWRPQGRLQKQSRSFRML